MTIRHVLGFETNDFSECGTVTGSASIESAIKRTGSYSLRLNPTAAKAHVRITEYLAAGSIHGTVIGNGAGVPSLYVEGHFYIATHPGATVDILNFDGTVVNYIASVDMDTTGKLQLNYWNGADVKTAIGAQSGALATGSFHQISISVQNFLTRGSSVVELMLDGVVVATGTGLTIGSGTPIMEIIRLGNHLANGTYDMYWDDVVVSDSAYVGEGEVRVMRPIGDGAVQTWVEGTGNTFAEVDDLPDDGDTTYVKASAAAQARFTLQSCAVAGVSGTIKAVVGVIRVREEGVDAGVAVSIRTTLTQGSGGESCLNAYALKGVIVEKEPATLAEWTTTDLDAIQVQIDRDGAAGILRMTSVYVLVYCDPADVPPPPPIPPPVPPPAPTSAQLADALAGRYGTVAVHMRYEWRDTLGTLKGYLTAIEDCEIDLDNSRAILRQARMKIWPDRLPASFSLVNDVIVPLMEFYVAATGSWQSFSLGHYRLSEPRKTRSPLGRVIWDVTASDLTGKLIEARLAAPYTVAAGTNYVTEAAAQLTAKNLLNALPPTALVTPVAFTWPASTSRWQIAADMLEGVNMFPPWPDQQAIFQSSERIAPSASASGVAYTTESEPRMIRPPFPTEEAVSRLLNRCVAKVEDPLRLVSSVYASNDDPSSAISTITRNATQSKDINADRMANATVMLAGASWSVWEAASMAETATLTTHQDPRRTGHEIYTLTIEGVEVQTRWRVLGWTLPTKPGAPMTHRLGRASAVTLTTGTIA